MASIARTIYVLQKMTLAELQEEWVKTFGKPTQQRDRVYLWKRLARKLQEDRLPKLTPDEEARIAEYQDRIRQLPSEQCRPSKRKGPTKRPAPGPVRRTPPAGAVIARDYKGQEVAVKVLEKGFEYGGRVYRSLSAVAREVTGTTWNGYTFFGLGKGGRQ